MIATKGGLRMDGDTLVRDASAGWLRAGVESSLRNLGTEYIDIYQVHWPDPRTPAEETAGALDAPTTLGVTAWPRPAGVSQPKRHPDGRIGGIAM